MYQNRDGPKKTAGPNLDISSSVFSFFFFGLSVRYSSLEGAIFGPAGCHRFGFEASDGSPPDRRPRAHRCSCPGVSGAGLRHAAAEVSVAEGGMLTARLPGR